MFRTKCIILKRKLLNDSNVWYTLFSEDFWKINAFWKERKKSKPLDVWIIVIMKLKTKSKVSTITSYDIFKSVPYHNWTLEWYNSYLKLLHYLNLSIPMWLEYPNIFLGYSKLLDTLKLDNSWKISLFFLYKISFILWINTLNLDIKNSSNSNNFSKINKKVLETLDKIKSSKIDDLLDLELNTQELNILESIIKESYANYVSRG